MNMFTVEKIKEFSNKMLDIIDEMQRREMKGDVIVQAVKSYLAGLADGIDFVQETSNDKKREQIYE